MKTLIPMAVGLLLLSACNGGSRPDSPPGQNNGPPGNGNGNVNEQDCSVPAATSGGEWQLVWSDEFEGDEIDRDKWGFETNCAGGGNNELQCYVDTPENAFVQDGALHIRAYNEEVEGYDGWFGTSGNWVTRHYSSARMRTLNRGDWIYGRIEVRARLPYGQGIWPAIWMLPSGNVYGGWPHGGEIDIMEAVNLRTGGANNNRSFGYMHFSNVNGQLGSSGSGYDPGSDLVDEFHTYALEWEQGELRWYIDDIHYLTQRQSVWSHCGRPGASAQRSPAAPFDQDFHLLINLAIGGNWPGSPDSTTTWPQTFIIDHVRVYECSADPATGRGCATISSAAEVKE